jgi:hypothetical protein
MYSTGRKASIYQPLVAMAAATRGGKGGGNVPLLAPDSDSEEEDEEIAIGVR